jgi:prepilin-type N-terminal cleavage/methylation domain-containing protein
LKSSIKSKGFSLIEILIALVILSISLLALAGLMVTTTRNNSFGGHMTEAATFAQDKLESLRTSQWGNVVTGNDRWPEVQNRINGVEYTRNWNVIPNAAAPNDTVKEITITISWNDTNSHSVSFRSVIFRPF